VQLRQLVGMRPADQRRELAVRHDRQFIENVANKIWYIDSHKIKEYPGTLGEYLYWMDNRFGEKVKTARKDEIKRPKNEKDKNQTDYLERKELNKRVRSVKKDLQEVEEKIERLGKEKKDVEYAMTIPANYSDFEKLNALTLSMERVDQELEKLHDKWEELFIALEELGMSDL